MCDSSSVQLAVNPMDDRAQASTGRVVGGVQSSVDLVRGKGRSSDNVDQLRGAFKSAGAIGGGPMAVGAFDNPAPEPEAALPTVRAPQTSRQASAGQSSRRVRRRNQARFGRSGTNRTGGLGDEVSGTTGRKTLLGE